MMLHFIFIIGLFFLAIGVTLLIRGVMTPAGPSTETIEQIGHYGFGGTLPDTADKSEFDLRGRFDDLQAVDAALRRHPRLVPRGRCPGRDAPARAAPALTALRRRRAPRGGRGGGGPRRGGG